MTNQPTLNTQLGVLGSFGSLVGRLVCWLVGWLVELVGVVELRCAFYFGIVWFDWFGLGWDG